MRLSSYRIRKKAKRHRVSYSFLFMRATEISYARSVASSILGLFGQLWIGSFHSSRPTRLWLTSKEDVQKARLSSGEIKNRPASIEAEAAL